MKRITQSIVAAVVLHLGVISSAQAVPVNWGVSWDAPHVTGQVYLSNWLVGHGFSDVQPSQYLGFSGSPDPFLWQPGLYKFEIVQEIAGWSNRTTLGFYTQNGSGLHQSQLFSGTEQGPLVKSLQHPFGLYIDPPSGNEWFTDRHLNTDQSGTHWVNGLGQDPQALIYELTLGKLWLVAFEDLDVTQGHQTTQWYSNGQPKWAGSDNDYNDIYLRVEAVPEPSTLALMGAAGAIGLFGWPLLVRLRARRQGKQTP